MKPYSRIAGSMLLAGIWAGIAGPGAAMDVPAARLTPVDVPGTTAFGASPVDLHEQGYVEQEYYISGVANRYRISNNMGTAELVDGGHPYRSRILVRRPIDRRKFNGTLAIEWYNVTTGQDIDFNYAASHEYLLRSGYAIVAVSVQLAGVNKLKEWSPARYGNLSLEVPNTDASGANLGTDLLGWDVFSQTIQALRQPGAVNPLAGLTIRRVIANGESQSASRLTLYYNAIDPLHRMVDGVVYYDVAGALRADNPTKAISVGTEIFGANPGNPSPDNANLRRWDVAGTTHVSLHDMQYADAIVLRDGALRGTDGKPATLTALIESSGCTLKPIWSTVPLHYVLNAAFDRMNRWIQGRGAPRGAPRFERDTGATPNVVRRDADGLVLGGIRLAELEYPTAVNRTAGNTGGMFCRLAGAHRLMSREELTTRYPDARSYLRAVEALTEQNRIAGYILANDAATTVASARRLFSVAAKPSLH